MPPSVAKFAPLMVVLAVAVYWVWPSVVGGSKPASKPAAAAQGFTAEMLAPKFPRPPERNPFQAQNAALAEDAKPAAAVARLVGGKADTIKAAENVKTTDKTKAVDNAKIVNKKDAVAKDAGLVLNATCIGREQRLAIINGLIYKPKDTIGTSEANGPRYVVADIMPDRVLLERQGQAVSLSYLDAVAGSGGNAAHSGAKEGGSGKGRAKKASSGAKSSSSKSTVKAKK
jgi:hypothetical protein